MSDEPFTTPGLQIPQRQLQPGEKLFEFLVGHKRHLCELRDHGKWGTEAQFFVNEEFVMGRRFDTRAQAIQWAELKRECRREGWGLTNVSPRDAPGVIADPATEPPEEIAAAGG